MYLCIIKFIIFCFVDYLLCEYFGVVVELRDLEWGSWNKIDEI